MFSSPRPILFLTELESPPIKELSIPSKVAARVLYNKMFEPGGYQYENLELQGPNPILSTRRGEEGKSICQIGSYSVKIQELQPEMPVDEFVNVVKTVLSCLAEYCPPFWVQRCKIQCLSQPNVTPNPLAILASRIGNVADKIEPFGRPPTFFGVRFRFRPWSPDDESEEETDPEDENADVTETQDQSEESTAEPTEEEGLQSDDESPEEAPGFVTVRFEPYEADPSQVWIEVAASYMERSPITFSLAEKNILDTCRFAADNCKRFLDQFDPHSDSTGDQS